MRTQSTRGTRRRLGLRLSLSYWKYLNLLLSKVALSSYDEAFGLPHPPSVSLGEDEALAPQTQERATDGGPH
jgi:hypothetical protein